jgi:hypothetical protein
VYLNRVCDICLERFIMLFAAGLFVFPIQKNKPFFCFLKGSLCYPYWLQLA